MKPMKYLSILELIVWKGFIIVSVIIILSDVTVFNYLLY